MMLPFQMLPTRAGYDTIDLSATNAKPVGQLFAFPSRRLKTDDLFGLLVGKLGISIAFTAHCWPACAAFLFHIFHVVVMRTKKQMIRAHTSSIVALVKDVHPLGNWPVVDFPTYPMSLKHGSATGGGYDAIATRLVSGRRPLPTARPLAYIPPKPLFQSSVFTRHEKRSYSCYQSQERDILNSVTANSVATLRGVDSTAGATYLYRIIADRLLTGKAYPATAPVKS